MVRRRRFIGGASKAYSPWAFRLKPFWLKSCRLKQFWFIPPRHPKLHCSIIALTALLLDLQRPQNCYVDLLFSLFLFNAICVVIVCCLRAFLFSGFVAARCERVGPKPSQGNPLRDQETNQKTIGNAIRPAATCWPDEFGGTRLPCNTEPLKGTATNPYSYVAFNGRLL